MLREKLPVDDFLEIIEQKLQQKNLILSASPGAGKTTRVPAFLTQKRKGKVLVLEPRRIAAVGAAQRIAEEMNWTLGQEVGYQVRFENRTSLSTSLIFMTEALLARRMISDPELQGVDLVVLDEFHERSATVDITLALLKELQGLCSRPQILVMSATLEPEKIQKYLGQCDFLEVPGKLFSLEVRKSSQPLSLNLNSEFFQKIVAILGEAAKASSQDVLAFLPGIGEIQKTLRQLEKTSWAFAFDWEVLHGNISLEDQKRILRRGPRRRLILSTNVAESSVTVDGVDAVVDSGLEKTSRFDETTGYSRLILQRISLSSARQRAGRSARQKPGLAFQMWSAHDEKSMSDQKVPELLRSNLSEFLLLLAHHGVRDFQNFDWFDKPDLRQILSAEKELFDLALLDTQRTLTEKGKKVLQFPLPVDLGALLFHFLQVDEARWGYWFVSLLNEADYLTIKNPAEYPEGLEVACDLLFRAKEIQGFLSTPFQRHEIHHARKQRIERTYQALAREGSKETGKAQGVDEDSLKKILLKAWPHRLCRQRGGSGKGVSALGRGVQLAPESFAAQSEFFIALQGIEGVKDAETLIPWACGVSKELIFEALAEQIETRNELVFDHEKNDFRIKKGRVFRKIELEKPSEAHPAPEQVKDLIPTYLLENFEELLPEQEELSQLIAQLDFLQFHQELLSEKEKNVLHEFDRESWILESLNLVSYSESSLRKIKEKNWLDFFELSSEVKNLIKKQTPTGLQLPSGKFHRFRYQKDGTVLLSARLQEFFGLKENPKVFSQQVKVTLHLLGPNYKLVQITQDLGHFWKSGYLDVRKEMRSRYPKHKWPEDPSSLG